MEKHNAYDDNSDKQVEQLIEEYVKQFFTKAEKEVIRIKNNIWSIKEDRYIFNIIITSLLCIFDAVLLNKIPDEKNKLFEELLRMNAHHVKSSKFCLVKNGIHLRIIRGLEDFDYSEFSDHVTEFRDLYPKIKEQLMKRYFPNET